MKTVLGLGAVHGNGNRQSTLKFKIGLCNGLLYEWYDDDARPRFNLNFRESLYVEKQES